MVRNYSELTKRHRPHAPVFAPPRPCLYASTREAVRFTYDPSTDVIVMSTRRLTKKFANLQRNKRVSLLLTDFQDQGRGAHAATGTISVTIEGALSITPKGSEAEAQFRALHLEHNEGYEQFITGRDIAIVVVKVLSARICDVQDNVRHWSRSS